MVEVNFTTSALTNIYMAFIIKRKVLGMSKPTFEVLSPLFSQYPLATSNFPYFVKEIRLIYCPKVLACLESKDRSPLDIPENVPGNLMPIHG